MLTLESKFSDYLKLSSGAGACEEAVAQHTEIVKKYPDKTIGDVFKEFEQDPDLPEGWCVWCLETLGKELDVNIRTIIIKKIKNEMTAFQLDMKCSCFLTTAEKASVIAIYEGKLPTAEKELRDGVVTRATAEVAP